MTTVKNYDSTRTGKKFYQKKWFKIAIYFVIILVIIFGAIAWKTGSVLNKISKGGILNSLVHSIPGVNNQLKGEADGRINIALLAMRGADDPAGGNLADSIEVISLDIKDNKIALMAVPRDLYVDNPATDYKTKINAVYAFSEAKGAGQGITNMEKVLSDVTGIPVQYGISLNYNAFNKLVDSLGGVQITLDKPFEESAQFDQAQVCDPTVFTVPTGKFETKYKKIKNKITGAVIGKKISKQYPLCTNAHPECGGDFKLPAGTQTLTPDQALCYARSRDNTNDFERAKRQQQLIMAIKDQLLSIGTLTDFNKINGILNSFGDNVKTDMQPWEMKSFYDLYQKMKGYTLYQRVLDESSDPNVGLLYGVADPDAGDILLPKGDNYNQIHNLFQNIFTSSNQTDPKTK